jgi:hypothetical protein
MNDEKFFIHPAHEWQRRYEALRASFVERLPASVVADRFSYTEDYSLRLRKAFVKQGQKLGLYDGKIVNLDFHTVPHYGDESELEKNWAGARWKTMKGALTLFAQDAETKPMVYTAADIKRSEADDQELSFLFVSPFRLLTLVNVV